LNDPQDDVNDAGAALASVNIGHCDQRHRAGFCSEEVAVSCPEETASAPSGKASIPPTQPPVSC
jgi:hypothetical protein